MAGALAVADFRLVVNDRDFFRAALFRDLPLDFGARHGRSADVYLRRVVFRAQQHIELNLVACGARKFLNREGLPFADDILLAAGLDDREHSAERLRDNGRRVKSYDKDVKRKLECPFLRVVFLQTVTGWASS